MTDGQLLDQIREYYFERFARAAAEHDSDQSVHVIFEPTYCDERGVPVRMGAL